MPKVVVNETLAIMFDMRNHLKINLIISDVTLLQKYESDNSTIIQTNTKRLEYRLIQIDATYPYLSSLCSWLWSDFTLI